jgi:hypothetical protein
VNRGRARDLAWAAAIVPAAALCAGCATGVVEVREPDGDAPPRATLAVQSTALDPRNGGQLVGPEALRPGDILHMREGDVPFVKVRQTLTYVGHLKYYAPVPLPERGGEVQ